MSCRRGAVREVAKGKIDGGRESQGMREGGRRCLWENRVAGLVMQAMQERWERVEKRRMEKRAGGRAAIDREWKSDSGSGLRSLGEMTRKRVPPRMARAFCLVWADRRQRQRRREGARCRLLFSCLVSTLSRWTKTDGMHADGITEASATVLRTVPISLFHLVFWYQEKRPSYGKVELVINQRRPVQRSELQSVSLESTGQSLAWCLSIARG
jgi:hypothetical protein